MNEAHDLEVQISTPLKVIFRGGAQSVTFPGEQGVFEILPNHKPLLSLLIPGAVVIDDKHISIQRGIVKVALNRITAIVEEA